MPNEQGKWAGKYDDPLILEESHEHLQGVLSQRNQELLALKAELEQARGYGLPDPRATVTERAEQRAQQRLDSLGIPSDAVTEVVRETFQELLQPVLAGMNARSYMQKTYEGYENVEDKLVAFLQENPDLLAEYQRTYQLASPRVAIEWAHDRWKRANPENVQRATNPGDAQMIPSSPNRLVNTQMMGNEANETEDKLWQEFRQSRSAIGLLKHRLNPSRTSGHLAERMGPY